MPTKRPVFLDLRKIYFPITALVSILHRASGFFLFLCIPFMLWVLNNSLDSNSSFLSVKNFLALPLMRFLIWLVLSALMYHLIAGIRHLLMDIKIGESLQGGRLGSKLVLIFLVLVAILLGVWLW